ncbi:unnamed protein product [Lasius platythorax]|uniref:Uncharacterized protein n=1 Tax=Lasius platythorax TaxID=488582 RepID=A0AAV2P401_9HYME
MQGSQPFQENTTASTSSRHSSLHVKTATRRVKWRASMSSTSRVKYSTNSSTCTSTLSLATQPLARRKQTIVRIAYFRKNTVSQFGTMKKKTTPARHTLTQQKIRTITINARQIKGD